MESFNFQNKEFSLVCFGEILLRLSPFNNELLTQGFLFEKEIGGAEFNVCSSVALLGETSVMLTKIPNNDIGYLALNSLRKNNIITNYLSFDDSKDKRLAIYYYEYGASPRKPNVIYDRNFSSFQSMNIKDIDSSIFSKAKIFHTTGISLGLCKNSKKLTIDLIKKFKKEGTLISFDVNFRKNIWSEEEAKTTILEILPFVDILFASEETFRKMFKKNGDIKCIMKNFAKEFNINIIASTQRTVISPKSHNFSSIIFENSSNSFFIEDAYENIEVIDRIGSGDAYVGGVLFGILKYNNLQKALKCGNANSVLKNTIKGDSTCINLNVINTIIESHSSNNTDEMNR